MQVRHRRSTYRKSNNKTVVVSVDHHGKLFCAHLVRQLPPINERQHQSYSSPSPLLHDPLYYLPLLQLCIPCCGRAGWCECGAAIVCQQLGALSVVLPCGEERALTQHVHTTPCCTMLPHAHCTPLLSRCLAQTRTLCWRTVQHGSRLCFSFAWRGSIASTLLEWTRLTQAKPSLISKCCESLHLTCCCRCCCYCYGCCCGCYGCCCYGWVALRERVTDCLRLASSRCSLIGGTTSLNGVLVIFASPTDRTPAFLQALLVNFRCCCCCCARVECEHVALTSYH